MNKRIRNLAEQARLGRGPEKIHISENGVVIFYLDELEKFAELIVRECANEILKWKSEPFPYDPEFGAKLIKDHFGVK